ncbi:MAG TPA: adhesin, partial [Paraburkholderia sp.]|nr:adhesin [Paraburkholderia sp.]
MGIERERAYSLNDSPARRSAQGGCIGLAVAMSVGAMAWSPAALAASVTDYIAVSTNVMTGVPTEVSNELNTMAIGPSANASGSNALAVGA